jgi:phosphatidylglycerophosphate synthase
MQVIVAIADNQELQRHGGAAEALLRDVSGIPLLIRIIATGMRAGAERVLIIHREELPAEIENVLRTDKILARLRGLEFLKVPQFEPGSPASWRKISGFIEENFLWLPWNWVTNKHGLANLPLVKGRPVAWDRPMQLSRSAVLSFDRPRPMPKVVDNGSVVTSQSSANAAERWLVAHSGKPLDGIYSKFNRWLCRPLVRVLAHTSISPNMVTFAGLIVAAVSAYYFSLGTYFASVIGAVLFFFSGLLDEVDGMLARVRFSDSALGTWLEGTVDNISYLLLFGGITVGLYHQRGPREVLIGEAALVGSILAVAVISWQRKRSTQSDRPHEYLGNVYKLLDKDRGNWISRGVREVHIFIKKGVFIHYVVIFTVLGLLPILLRLAAFASNLTWIIALYFSYRFFRRRTAGVETVELSKAA